MKQKSVSVMKGKKVAKRFGGSGYPDPSTRLGQIFTRLFKNRGRIVFFEPKSPDHQYLISARNLLTDFWGMDIRYFGKGNWCLVGEYIDNKYVDYLAERYKITP